MNTALLFEIFMSWAPMLLLIVVWMYYMKKSGTSNMSEYLKNHIEETRIMNQKLERIATALEEMKSNSENN